MQPPLFSAQTENCRHIQPEEEPSLYARLRHMEEQLSKLRQEVSAVRTPETNNVQWRLSQLSEEVQKLHEEASRVPYTGTQQSQREAGCNPCSTANEGVVTMSVPPRSRTPDRPRSFSSSGSSMPKATRELAFTSPVPPPEEILTPRNRRRLLTAKWRKAIQLSQQPLKRRRPNLNAADNRGSGSLCDRYPVLRFLMNLILYFGAWYFYLIESVQENSVQAAVTPPRLRGVAGNPVGGRTEAYSGTTVNQTDAEKWKLRSKELGCRSLAQRLLKLMSYVMGNPEWRVYDRGKRGGRDD